jgi:hypothetical protein
VSVSAAAGLPNTSGEVPAPSTPVWPLVAAGVALLGFAAFGGLRFVRKGR